MKEKALIFCVTPLHCLIAERIVKLNPDKSFYAIICIWPTINLEKITYYGNRLISICEGGECIEDKFYGAEWGRIRDIIEILGSKCYLYKYRKLGVKSVYVAHYGNTYFQILVGILPKDIKAITFDDGSVNLLPEIYEQNENKPLGRLRRFIGLVPPDRFIPKIVAHYTLYDAPNARREPPIKIQLFPHNIKTDSELYAEQERVVRIFLGQPIFEYSFEEGLSLSIEATRQAIRMSHSNLYLPHPREEYRIDSVEYISTPLIFEDYILKELDKNPTTSYVVSGFFSTSMLNMLGHPRLKFVSYRPSNVPERWNMMYRIIRDLGITIVDY